MSGERVNEGAQWYEEKPSLNTFGGMSHDKALHFIEQIHGVHTKNIVGDYLSGVSISNIASQHNVYPSFIEDIVNNSKRDIANKITFDQKNAERMKKLAASGIRKFE